MKKRDERLTDLFNAILTLESVEDCYAFFSDICTTQEIIKLSNRFLVEKKLLEGKTYREIYEETGISEATISRVKYLFLSNNGIITQILEKQKSSV